MTRLANSLGIKMYISGHRDREHSIFADNRVATYDI